MSRRDHLPPLAAEDHVCPECGVRYADLTVADAREIIAAIPARVRAQALAGRDPTRRPDPATWSVLEYVCHLRDVYMTSTIRLHRTRTEDDPALEPMLNDLRARRFGYNTLELTAVLDELAAATAGFLHETTRLAGEQWRRTATRMPGERRTALWLVRQAAHEGIHHHGDIAAIVHDEPAPDPGRDRDPGPDPDPDPGPGPDPDPR